MKQSVGNILDTAIKTAVKEVSVKQALYNKALDEKEKQVSLVPASKGEPAQQTSGSGSDASDQSTDFDQMHQDQQASKTMQDDSDAMKGDVNMDDVVEKLNTIRSGKSFKDSMVQQRFDQYFNSLSKDEKTAMFAFLKGIAGIVTGEVEPQQAAEPEKADITMHKGKDTDTKHVKPNVIKAPSSGGGKPKTGGAEDTSAPIQVKKR